MFMCLVLKTLTNERSCVQLVNWFHLCHINADSGQGQRSTPPTFSCTPINTEAVGEGRAKPASWSKSQSTLIGSPSWRGVLSQQGGGEAGVGRVSMVMFGGEPRHFSATLLFYSASLFSKNGAPDLINTSIRCDCINTRLIKAGSGL